MTFFFFVFHFLGGGGGQPPWAPPGHAPVGIKGFLNYVTKEKPEYFGVIQV